MKEFLDKEVTDLSDKEFEEKFGTLDNSVKDLLLKANFHIQVLPGAINKREMIRAIKY